MNKEVKATNILLTIRRISEGQEFELEGLQWEDPAAWGILLADLIGVISKAYESEGMFAANDAKQRLIAGLNVELEDSD